MAVSYTHLDVYKRQVLACYTGVWMQDAWYKAQNGTDEMWSTESNSMLIIMRPIMCSMIKVVPQAFILPLIPALSVVIPVSYTHLG